ncbi:uncharacterized protein TNIN_108811 [Trichonephila inaurata madagascariensis]|uniref:Uncharacterized protein n=1 Tax=Trichonephila inaurata madagascariensis TaxID=2747483 RepID=A0A8X6X017_9ARAC|nr:uncharacterized protein TNIN_108811 [Trichonephila inaurata madagascariensis]
MSFVNPPILSLENMALLKVAVMVCNDSGIMKVVQAFGAAAYTLPSKETEIFLRKRPLSFLEEVRTLYIEQISMEQDSHNSSRCEFAQIIKKTAEPTSNPVEGFKLLMDKMPCTIWENFVQCKIFTFSLPRVLEDKLFVSVRHVCMEIENWFQDHSDILRRSREFQIVTQHLLQWNSRGKIDRVKTAKAMVVADRLPAREKYIMAFEYCFREDLPSLWEQLDTSDKKCVPQMKALCSLEKRVDDDNWLKYVWRGILNPDELRRFFVKLSPLRKEGFLRLALLKKILEYEDFLFCYNCIDAERQETIRKLAPSNILEYFLDPPFHDKFLEVSTSLMPYVIHEDFIYVVHAIIFGRIMPGFKDFDYVTLLKKFWSSAPDHLKKQVTADDIAYGPLMCILKYDGSSPFLHETLLETCYLKNIIFGYFGVRYCVFKSEIGTGGNVYFSRYNQDCKRAQAVLYSKSAERDPKSLVDRLGWRAR